MAAESILRLLTPAWLWEEAAVKTKLGARGQQAYRGLLVPRSLLAWKVGWLELRRELGREVRSRAFPFW